MHRSGLLWLSLVLTAATGVASGGVVHVDRVSVSSQGVQGNGGSGYIAGLNYGTPPVLSADGRFILFASAADNLVADDTNLAVDVFVRDRVARTTERVSVTPSGAQGNGDSGAFYQLAMSGDGRFVAFGSDADNLVPGDTNGAGDVFVRDRQTGTTERVSVSSSGEESWLPSSSYCPAISRDGRFVAFISGADNWIPGVTGGVFVRDRLTRHTELVSVSSSGVPANRAGLAVAISADGRFVAFDGAADNLVPGSTSGTFDVFVHDRQTRQTERVNVSSAGEPSGYFSYSPSLSQDGRFVAFVSNGADLVPGDHNGATDVFVRDRLLGTTERVSVTSTGREFGTSGQTFAGAATAQSRCISGDGRFVTFVSFITNFEYDTTDSVRHVFVRDRLAGTTRRVSVSTPGGREHGNSFSPCISEDGRHIGYLSGASDLVAGDTNAVYDVFVADLAPQTEADRIAVFRPSSGQWFLLEDGDTVVATLGGPGDQPVPAAYLGTRHAQPAVFRPRTREWLIRVANGPTRAIQFGGPADQPVPGDYLGLGRTQIAVFRPGSAEWFIRDDARDQVRRVRFGQPGDEPVPADYLGLGRVQMAVFRSVRRRVGLLQGSADWLLQGDNGRVVGPIPFGESGDVPVPADYLGTGRAQIALFRPATAEWLVRSETGAVTRIQFGDPGDVPRPGDYLGLGRAQITVFRPSTQDWFIRADDGSALQIRWGGLHDQPVSAAFGFHGSPPPVEF
jgi:Tol biopolymer transport system component